MVKRMVQAFVSLGTNVGDRLNNLQNAREHLSQLGEVTRASRVYESEPFYMTNQPRFLNQVISLETSFLAHDLLKALLAIEDQMGRVRQEKFGPRVIDLDILFYGHQSFHTPALTIPHPLFHERPFVLLPMAEIAPEFLCGSSGRRIREMAEPWWSTPFVWVYVETN